MIRRSVDELVRRVERICDAHDEERPMRIALVQALRAGVDFGSYVWLLTDPVTEVGIAPLAEVPDDVVSALPGLIRARYLTTVNRWTSMSSGAASLQGATGGQPHRSLLYTEVLGDRGITDVATIVFRDGAGCWGWLDLWRAAGATPFDGDEVAALGACAPTITTALRRCHARTFERSATVAAREGPIVLLLSADLQVRVQTPDTDAYLRALLPPDADRRPIPSGAYNVAAQLLANEAGVDARPATSRVCLREGVWLTFRAARVEPETTGGGSDIAVSIEPSSPAERRDLFCRAHGLTARETELVDVLADGADTREVAAALHLSEHTVQDHLKSIFAKTGTRNRRTLLARLAGG